VSPFVAGRFITKKDVMGTFHDRMDEEL